MLTDFIADPTVWPLLAAAMAIILVLALAVMLRRLTAWRQPVRAYDQEQRALANFRRQVLSAPPSRDRRQPPPDRSPESP